MPRKPRGSTPSSPTRYPDNMPRAMVWMIASTLSFALMGAMVKFATDVPVPTKVFFRNLVTLAITMVLAWRTRTNPFTTHAPFKILILRALCGLGGVYFYFVALSQLTLADASLLNKTSPIFVAIFAVVILKEPFNRAIVPALIAAFCGALLVIKPSFDYQVLPALAGLASGFFAALAYVIVRSLKGRASPTMIIFVFSLVSCLATLPLVILNPPHPSQGQWLALLGTGIFAAGGQFGLTFAYHHAPASRISIFVYLHVLFAVVVGLVLFDERPDLLSVGGGLLIVGAAIGAHRCGLAPGKSTP